MRWTASMQRWSWWNPAWGNNRPRRKNRGGTEKRVLPGFFLAAAGAGEYTGGAGEGARRRPFAADCRRAGGGRCPRSDRAAGGGWSFPGGIDPFGQLHFVIFLHYITKYPLGRQQSSGRQGRFGGDSPAGRLGWAFARNRNPTQRRERDGR